MKTYNSYVEAVIANGSVKGVYCPSAHPDCFITGEEYEKRMLSGVKEAWFECNPADRLETLADFLASGKRLVEGDLVTDALGDVDEVFDVDVIMMNKPDSGDDKRYVLKAAAYDIETPEEKEALEAMASDIETEEFDAMTETAPQQFELLGKDEWDGEGLPPVGVEFEFSRNGISWESRTMLFNDGITCLMARREHPANRWHYKCEDPDLHFRKPETPEQRAERERLEAAYDLYETAIKFPSLHFDEFVKCPFIASYLRIVDKTGYRKETN